MVTYSEDFSNWSSENVTNGSNVTTSPDGTQMADTIIDSATTTRHINYESFSGNLATERTLSVYAKQNNLRYLFLSVTNSGDSNCYSAIFDLQSGIVSATKVNGTATNSASIISIGDGWYRCIISGTMTTATASYFSMIGTSDRSGFTGSLQNNNAPIYTGSSQSIYLWGAQLEEGSYPTSYIPTSGTTVTRLADSCLQGGFQSKNIFGSTQGSVVLEFKIEEINYIFDLNDNLGIRLRLFNSSNTTWNIRDYGGASWYNTAFNIEFGQNIKIGIKWDGTNVTAFMNGIKSSTTSTFASSMAINSISTDKLNNKSVMKLYNTALTDTELATLTTI